jgi:hypothetical protein
MMRVSRVLSLAIVTGSIAAGFLLDASVENLVDAGRLRTGRFEYRMLKAGTETAKFTVTVERLQNGHFRFTGEALGFNQKWESIATPLFQPVSAMLRMQRRDGKMYSMNLKYDGGRVTGLQEKESSIADRIDDHVPPGTVDQRIDWAAAIARRLEIGDKLAFTVYDPATGVSRVTGEVARAERIQGSQRDLRHDARDLPNREVERRRALRGSRQQNRTEGDDSRGFPRRYDERADWNQVAFLQIRSRPDAEYGVEGSISR